MRFIGSKIQLLQEIESFIEENVPYNDKMSLCDIFSGSVAVARYFKNKYKIISNDIMNFSYILQKGTIELNKIPNFTKLKKYLLTDSLEGIFKYFEETENFILLEKFEIEESDLFIFNNY